MRFDFETARVAIAAVLGGLCLMGSTPFIIRWLMFSGKLCKKCGRGRMISTSGRIHNGPVEFIKRCEHCGHETFR